MEREVNRLRNQLRRERQQNRRFRIIVETLYNGLEAHQASGYNVVNHELYLARQLLEMVNRNVGSRHEPESSESES